MLQLPVAHAQLPPWRSPDWSWAGYRAGAPLPVDHPGDVYNVWDYGVTGDGLTDDAPAIQAAINDAAGAGGGVVFLPAGRYAIHSPLRVTSSNTVIKGVGKGSTVLYAPYSLSETRGGGLNAAGTYSKYCWKDAFIEIFGKTKVSSYKTLVSKVTAFRARGMTSVRLERVPGKKISPGDELWLFQSEPPRNSVDRGTLAAQLHGWNTLAGEDLPETCANNGQRDACLSALFGKRDLVRWLVKVKKVKQGGKVLVLDRPLPFDLRSEWHAEFHRFNKPGAVLRESGVEDLTLEFPLTPTAPHHLEKGYNGVELRWTVDCWIRNVEVVNADNSIFVRTSHHVTVTGVETRTNGDRSPDGVSTMNGHIGIGVIGSVDVYVVDFLVESLMLHDTTVVDTMLTVWHRGRGTDLNLDAHRHICYGNLYSQIDLGVGSRPFTMGGRDGEGLPLAAYTTFWGLRSDQGAVVIRNTTVNFGACSYGGKYVTFVGDFLHDEPCPGWFIRETPTPQPSDLFVQQAVRRLGAVPV